MSGKVGLRSAVQVHRAPRTMRNLQDCYTSSREIGFCVASTHAVGKMGWSQSLERGIHTVVRGKLETNVDIFCLAQRSTQGRTSWIIPFLWSQLNSFLYFVHEYTVCVVCNTLASTAMMYNVHVECYPLFPFLSFYYVWFGRVNTKHQTSIFYTIKKFLIGNDVEVCHPKF